jgi:hypothetical protein
LPEPTSPATSNVLALTKLVPLVLRSVTHPWTSIAPAFSSNKAT